MAGQRSQGIDAAQTLRPEILARIELLRIVWRPDRDAAFAIKACQELEKYLMGEAPEKGKAD
jgi:hypothetical protein